MESALQEATDSRSGETCPFRAVWAPLPFVLDDLAGRRAAALGGRSWRVLASCERTAGREATLAAAESRRRHPGLQAVAADDARSTVVFTEPLPTFH